MPLCCNPETAEPPSRLGETLKLVQLTKDSFSTDSSIGRNPAVVCCLVVQREERAAGRIGLSTEHRGGEFQNYQQH